MSETLTVYATEELTTVNKTAELLVVSTTEQLIKTEVRTELLEKCGQGPAGPPGGDPAMVFLALGAVGGHRVVKTSGDRVEYASSDDLTHRNSVVGISRNAASDGSPVSVQFADVMTEPSWSWTPELPIFCSTSGNLTQTPPTTGFSLVVAHAVTPTKIAISIKIPVIIG